MAKARVQPRATSSKLSVPPTVGMFPRAHLTKTLTEQYTEISIYDEYDEKDIT